MAQWTAVEQLMLELVNRARLDPLGEAHRQGIDLNENLAAGTISSAAKTPLAPNLLLNDAARAHSSWMLAADVFSHTGSGSSSPGDRMSDAGYTFTGSWTWGENIAWRGTTGTFDPADYIARAHEGLFHSSGHRTNIMSENYREIGIGAVEGVFTSSADFNAQMTTQAFARSGPDVFVTGVAFTDRDADRFYDIGEASAGISVTLQGASAGVSHTTATAAAGGYAAAMAAGMATVTFSGGALAQPISAVVDASHGNVKVDLVLDDEAAPRLLSSANTKLGGIATSAALLGTDALRLAGNPLDNVLYGNSGANGIAGLGGKDIVNGFSGGDRIWGGAGGDTLDGGAGWDRLFGQDGWDILRGGTGNDTLAGGSGNDRLIGGGGHDRFLFDTALSARGNVDRIVDFDPTCDLVMLDDAIFAGAGARGVLTQAAFELGTTATSATSRILYDQASGALAYDADGAGDTDAIVFARFSAGLALTADDIVIY